MHIIELNAWPCSFLLFIPLKPFTTQEQQGTNMYVNLLVHILEYNFNR